MTIKQKILRLIYPLFIRFTRLTGMNSKYYTQDFQDRLAGRHTSDSKRATPNVSIYSLSATLNNGSQLSFAGLQGKKVLIVNTASDCGYTRQYEDLQTLYEKFRDKLEIIAFPANDFKEQEKGSDEEIAAFCKKNYGISFPLVKKSVVVKTTGQHPVFHWLSDAALNGWNNKAPRWNFTKYLISEDGELIGYFEPSVLPTDADLTKEILR